MGAANSPRPGTRLAKDPVFAILCPHCDSKCRIRGSRRLTPLARETRVQCLNVECGHTFVGQFVITHTISPSACPRDDVDLRVARPRRRVANDNPSSNVPPNEQGESRPEVPLRNDTG